MEQVKSLLFLIQNEVLVNKTKTLHKSRKGPYQAFTFYH